MKYSYQACIWILRLVSIGLSFSVPQSYADLEYYDGLEDVDTLIRPEHRHFSPIVGFRTLKGFENFRFFGDYGKENSKYPCYPEIPDKTVDCPLNWTAALIQYLFPSPDLHNFIPNQGSLHSPMMRMTPRVIGLIVKEVHSINPAQLKTDPFYLQNKRNNLLHHVYQEIFGAEKGKAKKLRDFYRVQAEDRITSCTSEIFLDSFYEIHQQAKSILRASGLNSTLSLTREEIDLLQKREETENFINALLGSLIETTLTPAPFAQDTPIKALLAFLYMKTKSRADFLQYFSGFPDLLLPRYQAWIKKESELTPSEKIKKDQWLNRDQNSLNKQRYLNWTEQFEEGLPSSREIVNLVEQPDLAAFYAHSYDIFESPIPPSLLYANAQHESLGKADNLQSQTVEGNYYTRQFRAHSDCGETSLRELFNLFLYRHSKEEQYFDWSILQVAAETFHLKIKPELLSFYQNPLNSDPVKANLPQLHDQWNTEVTSGLNSMQSNPDKRIHYLKPRRGEPVCEIGPGLGNMLNVIELLLGDNQEEDSIGKVTSLNEKLDRLCKVFSRENLKLDWLVKGAANKLIHSDRNVTIVFVVNSHHEIEWSFSERHIALNTTRRDPTSWKHAIGINATQALMEHSHKYNQKPDFSLLSWYVDDYNFDSILREIPSSLKEEAFTELLYSLPLRSEAGKTKAFQAILQYKMRNHFSKAVKWGKEAVSDSANTKLFIPYYLLNDQQVFNQHPEFKDLLLTYRTLRPEILLPEAASKGDLDLLNSLHEDGNVTFQSLFKDTYSFKIAVRSGNKKIVRAMIEMARLSPHEVYTQDNYGRTALFEIIAGLIPGNSFKNFKQLDLLRELLNLAPSSDYVSTMNDRGANVLHLAADAGHTEAVKLLIEDGKLTPEEIMQKDLKTGRSALALAAFAGHTKIVEYLISTLIQAGKTPQEIFSDDKLGYSPLHLAALSGKTKVIKTLIKRLKLAPAQVFAKNRNGDTIIHISTLSISKWNNDSDFEKLEALKEFLKLPGSSKQIVSLNNQGLSTLHIAADRGNAKTMKLLIDRGSPSPEAILQKDLILGHTPLSTAAINDHAEIVQLLTSYMHGAGQFPLQLTAQTLDQNLVETVIPVIAAQMTSEQLLKEATGADSTIQSTIQHELSSRAKVPQP